MARNSQALEADLIIKDRAINAATQGISITDPNQPDHPVIYVNRGFEKITGYERSEVLGRNMRFLHGADTNRATVDEMRGAIQRRGVYTGEILNYRKDGTPFWNQLSMTPVFDETNRLTHYIVVHTDVTESIAAKEKMARAAQEWQTVFDATNDAIWIMDQEHRILRCNRGAEELFQRSKEDQIGKHCWEVTHGTTQPIPECPINRVKDSLHRETVELQRDERWLHVTVDPILAATGTYAGAVHIIRDITERNKAEAALETHRNELRSLSIRLINAQEEERKRIARELHDELGQSVTAQVLNLMNIKQSLKSRGDQQIRDCLADSIDLVDRLSERVREMMLELRPLMLDDLGLIPTLRWYIDGFQKRTKVHTRLKTSIKRDRFPAEVETVLYRITQEALTNVAKHAKAKNVRISLRRRKATLKVTIEDDGQGFDLEALSQCPVHERGSGVPGMRERLLAVKGTFAIVSKKGKGTRLDISVPLGDKA